MQSWNDAISLADTNFRNTFTEANKVKWLSLILAQLLELRFSRDVTFAFFDITVGVQDYDLPDDCETDDIVSIQIETGEDTGVFEDYKYQEPREVPIATHYTILNGMFHLSVEPTVTKLGVIYYAGTHTVTALTLADTIPLPMAYRELLVYGLCERMAAARGDAVRKNNFKSDFDSLLADYLMNQLNNVPEYSAPRDELPRRARYGGTVATSASESSD